MSVMTASDHIRPKQKERAKSSQDIISTPLARTTASSPEPSRPSTRAREESVTSIPTKKLETKQPGSGSLRVFTGLKRSISSSNLRNNANKEKTTSAGGGSRSSVKTSGVTTPQTLEVRELFQKGRTCPDLDAVNRALESLKATPEDDPYVSSLTHLAARLRSLRTDSRRTLLEAMKERDRGNSEICRALCLSIVQAEHSEVDTKVYAYNILSTQASPGQGLNFLAKAWNLVKQHEGKRADCDQLLKVIAMLKEQALAGTRAPKRERLRKRDVTGGDKLSTIVSCEPVLVEDLLDVSVTPADDRAAPMSPTAEKILNWASLVE